MYRLTILSLLVALVTGCASPTVPESDSPAPAQQERSTHSYRTHPELTPPMIEVHSKRESADSGYMVLLPRIRDRKATDPQGYGLITDTFGEPVWVKLFDDQRSYGNDLRVQTYRGEPVLTYWRGTSREIGWGEGEYVVLDQTYKEIATVGTGGRLGGGKADIHDMVITSRDTALLLAYHTVQGERPLLEGVIQEVDIATGRVLFEWYSSEHVDPDESFEPEPDEPRKAYDYLHVNSVDEDTEGNLLLSARHTHALYKISKETGEVLWRLGGKHSDFTLGEGAGFSWQHDARWRPDDQISLLDNASNEEEGPPSRAIVLDVDEEAHTADLSSAFANPDGKTSGSQASHQILPSGNSLAGWGSQPGYTEFDKNGDVLRNATYPDGIFSYRVQLAEWTGQPAEPPVAVAEPSPDDPERTMVYASWNGATEVATWRVLGGPSAGKLSPVVEADKAGFETAIEAPADARFVAVEALDENGNSLQTSEPVKVAG